MMRFALVSALLALAPGIALAQSAGGQQFATPHEWVVCDGAGTCQHARTYGPRFKKPEKIAAKDSFAKPTSAAQHETMWQECDYTGLCHWETNSNP